MKINTNTNTKETEEWGCRWTNRRWWHREVTDARGNNEIKIF
jgi:hypothetical protein